MPEGGAGRPEGFVELARDLQKGASAFLGKYMVSDDRGALALFGRRYALLRPEILTAIQRDLEATIGRAAAGVMYRAGVASGRESIGIVPELAPHEGSGDAGWNMEVLNRLWAHLGVGQISLTSSDPARGVYEFRVDRSIIADAYGPSERPVCHLYAGWGAGILQSLTGREFRVEETECTAMGADRCVLIARRAD